jgi:predicted nucleic acid-binding protein
VILVDTSVWITHLRSGDPGLARALDEAQVLMHPFVMGELACGRLRFRDTLLDLFRGLPVAPIATDDEALRFIEDKRLFGRGIGYIDVHLLASAALAGDARLWTHDKPLAAAARDLFLT